MKQDEPSENIFDYASKQTKKDPTPSLVPKTPLQGASLEALTSDEIFEKINSMRKDLENEMDVLAKKAGLTLEDVFAFAENPDNIPPKTREKLKEDKKKLTGDLWGVVGEESLSQKAKKEAAYQEKKGRTKRIGGRRGWIDAR